MQRRMTAAVLMMAMVTISDAALAQVDNVARGERTFNQQCKTCHTVEKGGADGTGPNLAGLFGRKAGTIAGFAASDAMKASGIVWDDKNLAEYLKDPKARVPDGTMVFNGLKRQDQLDDVIAYLHRATQ